MPLKHHYVPILRYTALLVVFLSFEKQTLAQEVGYDIDFYGYADNREFKAPYTEDKTLFGTILSPKLYFAIDSVHSIYGGVHYSQDFGVNPDNKKRLAPIAYYNYKNNNMNFAIGHIPRFEPLKNVPKLLLSDTLMYDRPNIEGMYLTYQNEHVFQQIYIDWISEQSMHHREQFIVGIAGKYRKGRLYIAHDATMYHNALTSNENQDQHIQDNVAALFRLGTDLSRTTFLDSLTVDAGAVLVYDRLRTHYSHFSKGIMANVHMAYKQFFISNTLYLGQALNIPNGDPYYHRKKYDRLDLGWTPFKNKRIEGRFMASFHFTPTGVDNQQQFILRYAFGRKRIN